MEKFWNEWLESDMIEQEKKVIVLVKNIENGFKALDSVKDKFSDDKILRQKASILNNYFRDLYEVFSMKSY